MLGLIVLSTAARAQNDALTAAIDDIFTPVAQVENVPETLACTALFRALSALLDPTSDAGASFAAREGFLASVAGLLWANADGNETLSPDQVFAALLPPLNAAAQTYLTHMDTLAQTTDSPFDEAILSRTEYCIALHDGLRIE